MIRKRSGIYSDYAGATLSQLGLNAIAGGLGDVVHTGSTVGGLLSGGDVKQLDKDVEEMNQSSGLSFVPAVGKYRMTRKMLRNALKNNKDTAYSNIIGEQFGGLVSGIPAALLGGAVGYKLAANKAKNLGFDSHGQHIYGAGWGAVPGAIIGGSVPLLAAGALALIRKRRSAAEQKAHDQSSNISNWLVPGVANYNALKRVGRIRGEEIGEK